MPERMLIRGATTITMDERLGDLPSADVLIEDGVIRAVAPSLDVEDCEVVDAAGMICIPGFVDSHRHVWQTQLRTVATDWTLFDYFARMRSIYGSCYEPDDVRLGNYVGALEALDAGITTIVDHSHVMNSPAHADEAIGGLADAGVRGIFCYGLYPNPAHSPFRMEIDPGRRFEDARRVRREKLAADDALLVFGLAPTEVEALPFESNRAEIELGRELGARRISCHVALGAYDRGNRFVGRLAEAGLLGEDLLFVHGASLTDTELRAIAEAGAGISSTPETELQMGMGHPVARRASALGARVSIGIDIVSNYSGDMFSQMRLLLQAERGREHAARTVPPRTLGLEARDVLMWATVGGAKVLGLDHVTGTIAPGKQADIVLLATDAIHMVPVIDPIGAVVLNANVADVDTVLVAGRVVKRHGRLVGVDWPKTADALRESSERIRAVASRVDVAEVEAVAASLMLEEQ